ncbi:MAG: hypothetical protein WBI99_06405 [Limnochordia bacterium]|jgi:uncharacterized protein with PIN domain|nr:hypothetical protein [Limnochordia bacterium]MDI9465249.1 hypothetical protein [Bacillota bacterium]NLO94407.1 hypothetical protein [Bacillota bacterium]HOB41060.1 hypothetical protein [Limnochordia bacterium]HOK31868.1 hypothetical protein [Limnochordia bacterium]
MTLCPFCNQPMERVTPDDQEAYADLFRCGACQVEQAVYWDHGERLLAWHYDPSDEV